MATAQQIIERSLADIAVLDWGVGADAPDLTQGLSLLQAMMASVIQEFSGTRFLDVTDPAASFNLLGGHRVFTSIAGAKTFNMPANPRDGSRIMIVGTAAGAGPISLSLGTTGRAFAAPFTGAILAGQSAALRYRADNGTWTPETVAALGDQVPYPEEFTEGLAAMLSIRLASRHQQAGNLPPEVMARAEDCRAMLRDRYAPRLQGRGGALLSGDRLGGAKGG